MAIIISERTKKYLQDIEKYSVFTAEEEREYFREYNRTKSITLKQEIATHYLRLVVWTINLSYLSCGIAFDDLIQNGNEILFRVIDKFDVEKGYRFSSYLVKSIHNNMPRFLAKGNELTFEKISAHQMGDYLKILQLQNQLKLQLNRDPNIQELAEAMEREEKAIEDLLTTFKPVLQLDKVVGKKYAGTNRIMNLSVIDSKSPEELTLDSCLIEDLKRAFSCLNEKEKRILIFRFGKGLSLEKTGEIFSVTRQRIDQVQKKF